MKKMNKFIFREYDIRGIVEFDFTNDVVINLGKAFGTFMKRNGGKSVALSGDVRDTTPHLKSIFARGLVSTGIDVIDLGIIPTPINYYSMFLNYNFPHNLKTWVYEEFFHKKRGFRVRTLDFLPRLGAA